MVKQHTRLPSEASKEVAHQNRKGKSKKTARLFSKDSKKIKELKHSARRYSIKEGLFWSAESSFGNYYISPFAIAINASSSMVAMLSSVAGLLGPISQTFGSKLIEKFSRKKIVLKSVFYEALTWIPLIIIAFLFYKGIITNLLPLLLLLSFAFYTIFAHLGHPAWFSWMGDVVGEKYRGRWFSKRNLLIGFSSIVLAIAAAFFLDYLKQNNWTMFGFMLLFFLAFTARLLCWNTFKKQYEPKIKLKKGYYFSFWDFIINAPKNNFGKFTIFRALLGFASSICAPLTAVYLLRHIGFSYTSYMIIMLGGTFVSLFALGLWGKFADKYGNYKVIALTTIFIPITPILWILSPSMLYLLLIPSIINGIAWAGFHLAAGNFIYDNVSQQKRGLAVSYYNMTLGIGVFLGAGLGALLIKFLNTDFIAPIIIVFLISSLARMLVVFFGLSKIKEIRKTKKIDSAKALERIIFKETKPTLSEEVHEIMSIKKYLRAK